MDIQDVLRILKTGAEKPKDDLNDYTKGKRDGLVEAYSHAWTLVKNLTVARVSNSVYCECAEKEVLMLPHSNTPYCSECGKNIKP